jgi:glyoxylase-like metal-dependent hydrolase (beta-lactamase superfamily II)
VDPGDLGIHRLELPTPFPIGPVNAYLIEDEPLTLVDAGPNSATTMMALEQRLAARGHRVEDIGLILVTHQHLDHIGLVGVVAQRSGADVVALDALTPWLGDYERSMRRQYRYADEVMAVNGVPREVRAAVKALTARLVGWGAPVTVTTPLAPGEQVTLRDRTFTVLHRPGHSPSDTVFLDERSRVMLGGDHLLPEVSSNPVITRPLAGEPAERPQALVTYLASLAATAAIDLDLVLPGHGDPIAEHRELIAGRLVMHDRRYARLHELIAERPCTAYELAIELWNPDVAAGQALLTVSEVLGHVDLLLNDGQVREERDADGPIRFSAV